MRFIHCSGILSIPILAISSTGFLNGALSAYASTVGEVEIRDVLLLTEAQRLKLKYLVQNDNEAQALFTERMAQANSFLETVPRPLQVIHYAGLLNTDPRRIKDVNNLSDMDRIAALYEVWQVSPTPELEVKLKEYIGAWAAVYEPTGNDVNENKLLPLYVAYHAVRELLDRDEKARIDAWLTKIGEMHYEGLRKSPGSLNNRFTKRLRILAVLGMTLGISRWVEAAWEGYESFVKGGLYPDGTSQDFKQRDTLTYHTSALYPLLDLALLAKIEGRDLYSWQSSSGSSLKKSVDFVVPYAAGTKKHAEWVNSTVALDRERANAGIEEYQPGKYYEPRKALKLMEQAAYFDKKLTPLVLILSNSKAARFPTWRIVLNEAAR